MIRDSIRCMLKMHPQYDVSPRTIGALVNKAENHLRKEIFNNIPQLICRQPIPIAGFRKFGYGFPIT